MTTTLRNSFALALAVGLIALTPAVAGAAGGEVADLAGGGDAVVWQPTLADYEALVLTVSGPGGVSSQRFGAGEQPRFSLFDRTGNHVPDGSYTWQLVVIPRLSAQQRAALDAARARGESLGFARVTQSGYFSVAGGGLVAGGEEEGAGAVADAAIAVEGELDTVAGAEGGSGLTPIYAADQVINDDLIVDGSACVGQDCVNGESFGFDTIRLKENNLRIKFDDTSSTASFPDNDWQLTANDTPNGGAEKFSIDDVSNGRTPFTIEAAAPSNSLYVDDGGRIGLGTSTPVVELHVVDGDTPTLRLEQDGSSGFTPQTWDVAGNEAGFFVRDATNGSTLPFRIRPGAAGQSLVIDNDNNIGVGLLDALSPIHIQRNGSSVNAAFRLENTGGTSPQTWIFQNQATNGSFNVTPQTNGTQAPLKVFPGAPENSLVIGQNSGGTSPRVGIHIVSGIGFPLEVGTDATNGNGAHVTAAGIWTDGSSRVNKTNIVDLAAEDALAAVTGLVPVRYVGKNDVTGEEYLGFIAEDVPELVAMNHRKGLSPMDIVAALTKVVQLQQQQNVELAERLARLEALLAAGEAAE